MVDGINIGWLYLYPDSTRRARSCRQRFRGLLVLENVVILVMVGIVFTVTHVSKKFLGPRGKYDSTASFGLCVEHCTDTLSCIVLGWVGGG